jgi:hypothetical protein
MIQIKYLQVINLCKKCHYKGVAVKNVQIKELWCMFLVLEANFMDDFIPLF